jgi:hypothetical protein
MNYFKNKILPALFVMMFYVTSYKLFGFEITVIIGIIDIICYLKIWMKQ